MLRLTKNPPQQVFDIAFNDCVKSKGIVMHPIIKKIIEAIKKSYSSNKCPNKGRIDIIKDFKITPDLFPTFVLGDEKFSIQARTLGIIVNQNRWTPVYRFKLTGEIWN